MCGVLHDCEFCISPFVCTMLTSAWHHRPFFSSCSPIMLPFCARYAVGSQPTELFKVGITNMNRTLESSREFLVNTVEGKFPAAFLTSPYFFLLLLTREQERCCRLYRNSSSFARLILAIHAIIRDPLCVLLHPTWLKQALASKNCTPKNLSGHATAQHFCGESYYKYP